MSDIKKTENNIPSLLTNIDVFENTVETLAKLKNCTKQFITDAILSAANMGVTNPIVAIDMFHDIQGKASLKGKVAHSLFIKKGELFEPFEIIQDAEPMYYYVNADLKEYLQKYAAAAIEGLIANDKAQKKEGLKTRYDKYINDVLKANLVTDPPKTNGKIDDNYVKTPVKILVAMGGSKDNPFPIYEAVTTLRGKRMMSNGIIVERQASYKLSTAIARGLYLDKNNNISSNWQNLSRMMMRRCSDMLFDTLGLDPTVISLYDRFSYKDDTEVQADIEDSGEVYVVPTTEIKKEEK